jgi:hypothetical protein
VYRSVEENYDVYCGDNILLHFEEICNDREGKKKKRDKDGITEMRKINT